MKFTVTVDADFDRLINDLQAFMQATDRGNERDARRLAELAEDRMRRYVPVDTGRLRDSIGVRGGRDTGGFYLDVGSFDVEYSDYVEFGTSRMRPQAFVRPGFAEAVVVWVGGR